MFEKLIEGIKHYKNSKFDRDAYLACINALPKDYQIAYNGISNYMWSSGVDGGSVMETLLDVLAIFEEGAKDNKEVLNIVGEDVIGFADSLLQELPGKTWVDKMKSDMNKKIIDGITRQN